MALFPQYDTIPYLPGIKITPVFNTAVSTLPGGIEKRRAKSTFPLYDLEVSYDLLTKADARTIWQFYKDRQGAYEAFYFYLPYTDTYENEYCGTGDGVTSNQVFEVPGKEIAGVTVYQGGIAKTGGGVDYTLDPTGGIEGGAQVEWNGIATLGSHITIDFTGYYKFKVRFADDNLPFTVFYQSLTNMGIKLTGVR